MNNYTYIFFLILFSLTNYSTTAQTDTGSPIKIFYGLNQSHSNCWAKYAPDGTLGITYFEAELNRSGKLVYESTSLDGIKNIETVTTGSNLEISVLIFDDNSSPHIFLAKSTNTNQQILHYQKVDGNWSSEIIINWNSEGGKYINELSARIGPANRFHLLVLKTRSNPDSEDYFYAFQNSNLYYVTKNNSGWLSQNVDNYDMFYTCDEYVKGFSRQDIAIDKSGKVHIVFGQQIDGLTNFSPTRLRYATNQSGKWVKETAVNYAENTRDSGGWYPSICLDNNGTVYVSCAYIARVPTGSAARASLILTKRLGNDNWQSEVITNTDDGYFGRDGRRYTGGLTNLIFDNNNNPHILFTDIASSHAGHNYLNLGNIRHAVKENEQWTISTIYTQPLPEGFYNATEMYSMCFLYDKTCGNYFVVGQEVVITDEESAMFNLLQMKLDITKLEEDEEGLETDIHLNQNYPNPFNPSTVISYSIPVSNTGYNSTTNITLKVYDILGNLVTTLLDGEQSPGYYKYKWETKNLSSGIYIYKLSYKDHSLAKKMTLLR